MCQLCPLEFGEELLKLRLERQVAACYDALHVTKEAVRWYERSLGSVDDMLAMLVIPRQEKLLKQLKGQSDPCLDVALIRL